MKLEKVIKIEGTITLKTGLHIGAGNDEINIGGIDNPVVKNPLNNEPYIPGSSLKGKVRTLLEWYEGKVKNDGKPFYVESGTDELAELFGNGANKERYTGGPTRVSFSDCFLTEDSAEELRSKGALTESKYEVTIDRRNGTAAKAGPRQTERVPAGAKFNFLISLKVFEGDDDKHLKLLLKGLKLLELDALGGNGSRGYGRLKLEFSDEEVQKEFDTISL